VRVRTKHERTHISLCFWRSHRIFLRGVGGCPQTQEFRRPLRRCAFCGSRDSEPSDRGSRKTVCGAGSAINDRRSGRFLYLCLSVRMADEEKENPCGLCNDPEYGDMVRRRYRRLDTDLEIGIDDS